MVVTRPGEGGRTLAELLTREGLRVESFPALEVVPPEDDASLREAAARAAAGSYEWIVLTSSNGVRAFAAALARRGGAAPAARVAVVGAATATAARREGWSVDLVPETFTAEGLLEAFGRVPPLAGARVLLAVAEAARDVLPVGLAELGAEVDVVVAYRTLPAGGEAAEAIRSRLAAGKLDLVTFASPSAARAFLDALGPTALELPAAVIGPVTAATAERLGYRVVAVAEPHTAEGLVEAVLAWVRSRGEPLP